jgi:hypothetical protein
MLLLMLMRVSCLVMRVMRRCRGVLLEEVVFEHVC